MTKRQACEVGTALMSERAVRDTVRSALALRMLELDDQRTDALDAWFAAGAPLGALVLPRPDEHLEEA
jgi:hypothetical protein